MIMVGDPPSSLELTVNSYGYTLVRYFVSRRLMPIVFDVNSFSLNRLPDTETRNYYILSSVAANRIAGQLGADIDILDIRPDTLFFSFTRMISRKLPVKPALDLDFNQQFMVKGNIDVEPDSVMVHGPESVIDTMKFVPTKETVIRGLNKSTRKNIELTDIEKLTFSPNVVLVNIPVEQFTEASINIPVEVTNLPDTLTMKTFPSRITVSYLVALSDYDKVNAQLFRATVDYLGPPTGPGRLAVRLVDQPDFVRSVRFSPQSVDFIIER